MDINKVISFVDEDLTSRLNDLTHEASVAFDGDLESRFQAGSFGHHELTHLSFVQYEVWQHYISGHPLNLFVPEALRLAMIVEQLMFEYYQLVACEGP